MERKHSEKTEAGIPFWIRHGLKQQWSQPEYGRCREKTWIFAGSDDAFRISLVLDPGESKRNSAGSNETAYLVPGNVPGYLGRKGNSGRSVCRTAEGVSGGGWRKHPLPVQSGCECDTRRGRKYAAASDLCQRRIRD